MIRSLFFLLLILSHDLYAQDVIKLLDQPVTLDTSVRAGTLKNGLRYYLKNNKSPEGRLYMRLNMGVGYNDEEPHEYEFAHLIEHLGFQKTKHFDNPSSDFMKRGVVFGEEINGTTSNNRTAFNINISATNKKLTNDVLLFFVDIIHNIILDSSSIEKQRSVMISELAMRNSYIKEMWEQFKPQLMGASRFSQHQATNSGPNVETFPHNAIRKFYTKWYQPHLATLIITGDMDVKVIEANIKMLFSAIENTSLIKPDRTTYLKVDSDRRFLTVTHKRLPRNEIDLYSKMQRPRIKTYKDYKTIVQLELLQQMLSLRCSSINERYREDEFRIHGAFEIPWMVIGGDKMIMAELDFSTVNDSIRGLLKNGLQEVEKIRRFGFTDYEFESAKEQILANHFFNQQRVTSQKSNELIGELDRFIYLNFPHPDYASLKLVRDYYLNKINLSSIDSLFGIIFPETKTDVVVLISSSKKVEFPIKNIFQKIHSEVKSEPLARHTEYIAPPIMQKLPQAELEKPLIKSITEIKSLGITTVEYFNGIKILFRPTEDSQDIIFLRGISNGACQHLTETESIANTAALVVSQNGLGDLNASQLRTLFRKKSISFILASSFIAAQSKKEDIETVFQAIYQYATNPKNDPGLFPILLEEIRGNLTPKDISGYYGFTDTISLLLGEKNIANNDNTSMALSRDIYDKIVPVFQRTTGNPSCFTYVISGNFELSSILSLANAYFGNIPAPEPNKRDVSKPGAAFQRTAVSKIMRTGAVENKAIIELIYKDTLNYNEENFLAVELVAQSLAGNLVRKITMQEGKSYVVFAGKNFNPDDNTYKIRAHIEIDPKDINTVIKMAKDEILKMKTIGTDDSILKIILAHELETIQSRNVSPDFWVGYIDQQLKYGLPMDDILKREERVKTMTITKVKEYINQYLKDDALNIFIQLPASDQKTTVDLK